MSLATSGPDILKCINLFLCVCTSKIESVLYFSTGEENIFQVAVKDAASLQKLKTDLKITFTSFPDVLYFTKKAKQ